MFFPGAILQIEHNTHVTILSSAVSSSGSPTVAIFQASGNTWSRVSKLIDTGSSYAVVTPSGVRLVRGTEFKTTVHPDGGMDVRTAEGVVEVSKAVDRPAVSVRAGEVTRVGPDDDDEPSEPEEFELNDPEREEIEFLDESRDRRENGEGPRTNVIRTTANATKTGSAIRPKTATMKNLVENPERMATTATNANNRTIRPMAEMMNTADLSQTKSTGRTPIGTVTKAAPGQMMSGTETKARDRAEMAMRTMKRMTSPARTTMMIQTPNRPGREARDPATTRNVMMNRSGPIGLQQRRVLAW